MKPSRKLASRAHFRNKSSVGVFWGNLLSHPWEKGDPAFAERIIVI